MNGDGASARYHHRRPYDQATYDRVRSALSESVLGTWLGGLIPAQGIVVRLAASDVIRLTILDQAQVVHLYAWNVDDPDERIWTNETSSKENAFLVVDHRIWGTMARFRALLTVVEESVNARTEDRTGQGRHHFVLGGAETPLAWKAGGGDPGVPSAWDCFRALLESEGISPALYRDHVSLFQRVRVDVETQRFDVLPSEARANDMISLFAEIPLAVALVPSSYRGGGTDSRDLDGTVHRVRWAVAHVDVPAPGWPYPGVPYPDLAPYVDATGRRQ